ncbi:hypothetical protein VPH35_054713 [Triticum aestivum]|uniref:Uncharacterized protein n=1 Tax=Triticum aestivum TaxID=4565 RepID=A0A077RYZ3_WHEAT|nr:unnamed protein product [Triticum aestivum]
MMPMTQGKKRRRANKHRAAARTRPRPTPVCSGKEEEKEKEKASSVPSETATAKQPIYLVVEHGLEEPTHSVIKAAAGASTRRLRSSKHGMSFAAVGTAYGPRIAGLGLDRTTLYDPKASAEYGAPRLVYSKMHPVLIAHGCKLHALSRRPSVVPGRDFMPWFHVLDLNDVGDDLGWRQLPLPPIFPCLINPLEYRDRIKWDMVDDKNLPFVGQAVPLGGCRFVAYSEEKGGAAAVYDIEVLRPENSVTGKTKLSVVELQVISKGIVPGQLLCSMGNGSFSSFDI